MKLPLVSIIIPVYNGSNYMKEAIDSALNQTYKNIEVIVINDGSDDNGETEQIAYSYGDKIRYYAKENGGVSTALNLGIEKMKGEYFSWLSHDDLYLSEKIEKQVEALDIKNKKEIIVCGSSLIDKDGKSIISARRMRLKNGRISGVQMFKNVFNHGSGLNGCTLLIPKMAFEDCGKFNTNLRYTQDVECWSRMMIKGYSFIFVDEVFVYSRVHANQTTYRILHLYKKEFKEYNKMLVDYIIVNALDKQNYLKTILKFNYYSKNNDGIKYIKRTTNIKSDVSCYLFYIKGVMYRITRYFYHRFVKTKSFNS